MNIKDIYSLIRQYKKTPELFLDILKKILWYLGRKAFLVVMISILLNLIFGAILLYKHFFLIRLKVPELTEFPIQFNSRIYEKILEIRSQYPVQIKNSLKKEIIEENNNS